MQSLVTLLKQTKTIKVKNSFRKVSNKVVDFANRLADMTAIADVRMAA